MLLAAAPLGADPVVLQDLAWIMGILITVMTVSGGAAGWSVWKVTSLMSECLQSSQKQIDTAISVLNNQKTQDLSPVKNAIEEHSARINGLETFDAGIVVMMREINNFRLEVKQEFRDLKTERKDDMNKLHARLDSMRDGG